MTDDTPVDGAPEAAANDANPRSERHWLEYAAVALAGAAFVVSCFAATFSGWQAWIASDAEERQLRAYLEVTDLEVVCPDCATIGPVNPSSPIPYISQNFVHIRFENSGQTPARAIRYKINWLPIPSKDAPLPENFEFPDYSPTNTPAFVSTSELARDQHRDGAGEIEHDIDRFRTSTKRMSTLYLYGHLDYCDVFGKPRATAFCFLYAPNVGEKLPICDRYNGEIKAHHKCS
jgi:hypothetical protein